MQSVVQSPCTSVKQIVTRAASPGSNLNRERPLNIPKRRFRQPAVKRHNVLREWQLTDTPDVAAVTVAGASVLFCGAGCLGLSSVGACTTRSIMLLLRPLLFDGSHRSEELSEAHRIAFVCTYACVYVGIFRTSV